MTPTVTIREVNQQTSMIFDRVRDGEELIVTRSGRPLARITPFTPVTDWEQLVTQGTIIPATDRVVGPYMTHSTVIDLDTTLADERADQDSL